MDFTVDYIPVVDPQITANFMFNPPDFIINFMENFITSTRISLKSKRFHEIHNISQDFT